MFEVRFFVQKHFDSLYDGGVVAMLRDKQKIGASPSLTDFLHRVGVRRVALLIRKTEGKHNDTVGQKTCNGRN